MAKGGDCLLSKAITQLQPILPGENAGPGMTGI